MKEIQITVTITALFALAFVLNFVMAVTAKITFIHDLSFFFTFLSFSGAALYTLKYIILTSKEIV